MPEKLQSPPDATPGTRGRQLVWLQGDALWAQQQAAVLLAATAAQQVLWIGQEAPAPFEATEAPRVQRWLGRETDAVVLDAWAGFNPNAFGQSVGTVRAGGVLFLLTPAAAPWSRFDDPEQQNLATLPYDSTDVGHRFVQHLIRVLQADGQVLSLLQLAPQELPAGHFSSVHALVARLLALQASAASEITPLRRCVPPFRSQDQQQAVAGILQALNDAVPLVLTADRGRGKTAALGLAAAHWLEQQGGDILVTAPSLAALDALFERVQAQLPGGELKGGCYRHARGSVRYMAPERLLQGDTALFAQAQLLLVDEAAAIPAPVLSGLLARFGRILFASTVHGYEGTGRGFAVRFRRELERRAPGWRALSMTEPVRWSANDPLEALSFRMLLLDAEPAEPTAVRHLSAAQLAYRRLDRDQLLQQPALLEQLFGLLVLAHYRTTPGDLRILLDSPNLSVWVACGQGQLVGALLVVEEGGLPADLAAAIHDGYRRPAGHLIPQALIGQEGLLAAAPLRCLRVMRIATHPALERRGIASALLSELASWAQLQGQDGGRPVDYLGTCFGISQDLLGFWRHNGYKAIRLGTTRDPVGGTFAGILAQPVSEAGTELIRVARQRLRTGLLHQLPAPLAQLEADLVVALLPDADVELADFERAELDAFALHKRAFESCEPALWKLCSAGPEHWQRAGLRPQEQRLLVRKLLQRHSWEVLAADSDGGRRLLVRQLREVTRQLLCASSMGMMR
ncbi:tRNA(Met) cytidine acetyltransferase TmcA [Marinobacterium sedimentorum]|uniref:tRNA(Met) cytidine acetyltransferase TmcA n=1 Tax=Marinobacterium sedimentorum TaxID=2927804 RepID=UPI0020C6A78E|nr:GNAT family N-acetyltransferase [Marinobacterium sedimentorum]MCP8688649.1 GNAT family N-acetyltransferase [Marinobacterium sedimentorum]